MTPCGVGSILLLLVYMVERNRYARGPPPPLYSLWFFHKVKRERYTSRSPSWRSLHFCMVYTARRERHAQLFFLRRLHGRKTGDTCPGYLRQTLKKGPLWPRQKGTFRPGKPQAREIVPLSRVLSQMDQPTYEQHNIAPYQPNQMMGVNTPAAVGQPASAGQPSAFPVTFVQFSEEQLSYQRIYQQHLKHLQEQLQTFWQRQHVEIVETTDFKNHNLPLARIKKIMKADEDVRMVASEALVLFARACEIFILELTLRAWSHTEENKRRTLQKNDLAVAITRTDVFDFLVDIVPRDEVKDGLLMSVPGVGGPSDPVPYYYLPAQVGSSGMVVGGASVDQSLMYAQQPYSHLPQQTGPPQQEQHMLQQELPPSNA
ncbi:hypothetical protein Taro_014100 [Colocasia esculenta]|uniref:Transcription factor CBF/NF-Y/archaeal histone domain-containing protein n=1 Tax=Colocasia esculenta TaxID=4460 RepID=A0A843UDK4_COLES|nr:hypothetical protein [Colocasia esculenta]